MNYEFRDWKGVFQDVFRSYNGLTNINYVFVDRELCSKGLVRIGKEGPNGEYEEFQVLKKGISVENLSDIPEFRPVNGEDVFQYCPACLPSPGKLPLFKSLVNNLS
tara:strand:+ start:2958 stop:3275 length:318 start_codon:yes stop_codon:yes gene_type:complete